MLKVLCTEKTCSDCNQIKALSEFYKQKGRSGVVATCKDCHKIKVKKWRLENLDKVKMDHKKYKADHPEKIRELNRRWVAEHPDRYREMQRKSNKKTRSIPKGRLNQCMGTAIRISLKNGSKAKRHWEDIVGYTTDQLKRHLEKRFKPGMTWENQGTCWQIDHKIPKAVFNFERPEDLDFKKCWALKNLQPMEARQNQSKAARICKPFQPSLTL